MVRIGGYSGIVPAWVGKPGVTAAEHYYGFAHMEDHYWHGEQQNWAALNLTQFGPVVNTDSAGAPYQGSHMLTTEIVSSNPHASTTAAGNADKFGSVWAYLVIPV